MIITAKVLIVINHSYINKKVLQNYTKFLTHTCNSDNTIRTFNDCI